jgi:cytochrome bd-type quinol oxidase subunit 2
VVAVAVAVAATPTVSLSAQEKVTNQPTTLVVPVVPVVLLPWQCLTASKLTRKSSSPVVVPATEAGVVVPAMVVLAVLVVLPN